MGWRGWVGRRMEVLFRKESAEDELDDEIRFHLEMEIREHMKSGLDPAEARRRAMVDFGGVERFKEEVRDVRGGRWLDDFRQDLVVAVRGLGRQRAFALAAVLTLGLGIGGNVAMYGVLQSSVFASLPYPDADRLITGRSTMNDGARLGPMLSGFDFMDYREQATTLTRVGAIAPFPQRLTVEGGGEVERADGVQVTPGYFEALGVAPVAGRSFAMEDGEQGAAPVAILSHGYWVNRFGSDPTVVGRTFSIAGGPRTIVGVMPPEARFMVDTDLWLPIIRGRGMAGSRAAHNLLMVARLAPNQTLETAQIELDAISNRLTAAYPETNTGKGILLTPAREMLVEGYRSTLALLMGAVALLLVVACANVAGLLLARGNARTAEMSVRSVMGAARGRLVRQLVTENSVLAVAAGLLGVGLAAWGGRALRSFVSMDRLGTVDQGGALGSVGYALGLALVTVLIFGLIPAFRLASANLSGALRSSGRVAGSRSSARWRSGLVIAQVALTTVLLSVASLLGRSLQALTSADLGFNSEAVLTAEVDLPAERYSPEERIAFYDEFLSRASALPGVEGATLSNQLPLRDPGNNWGIGLPGELSRPDGVSLLAHQRIVYPGYFQTLGTAVVSGRDLAAADRGASPPAVVISSGTASHLFGTEDPVGRLVDVQGRGQDGAVPHQVVGVVPDMVMDWTAWGTPPAMYFAFHDLAPTRMRMAVRYRGDAAPVIASVRELVAEMDRGLPLDGVETMESIIDRGTRDQQSLTLLVGMFAGIALLLAGVGLYGVLAYQVTRQVREIGIRIALGASVAKVSRSVVKGGWTLVAIGLAIGIPAALLAGRLVQEFLFGVGVFDPVSLLAVSGFLGLVASAACLLPARRAAGIDPSEAFRSE